MGLRLLSKENNLWKITKPERTGMRYQYPLFSFPFCFVKFHFSCGLPFLESGLFVCLKGWVLDAESYGKEWSYGEDGAGTDG